MAQPRSDKIRYTTQHYNSAPTNVCAEPPIHVASQNEPLAELQHDNQQDEIQPVIEIVTCVNVFGHGCVTRLSDRPIASHETFNRRTHMIIHSEALSKTISDVVKSYPDQNLCGTHLIIHEPYPALLHHMSDFECLTASNMDATEFEHVQILLEFLRPQYTRCYLPAIERSLTAHPTVRFDDLWIIMKPGTLGYVDINGYRHGCVINKCTVVPPKLSDSSPVHCNISFWFLRVDWPSDGIGYSWDNISITAFDGEIPIDSLRIYPAEFLDNGEDNGKTRYRFIERGKKLYHTMFREPLYFMEYYGHCMDDAKQWYNGEIVIGGCYHQDRISGLKHSWSFNWISPHNVAVTDIQSSISRSEVGLIPERDGQYLIKDNHLFILSPCLSALSLPKKEWMPINAENLRQSSYDLDVSRPRTPPTEEPPNPSFLNTRDLNAVQALLDFNRSKVMRDYSPDGNKGRGVVILFEGPPGVGKTYAIEFIARRNRRPFIPLTLNEFQTDFAWWSRVGRKWNPIFVVDSHHMFASDLDATLTHFSGVVFLTCRKFDGFGQQQATSFLGLKVGFSKLTDEQRYSIWSTLEQGLSEQDATSIHENATRFLKSREMKRIEWNGHEINHCFGIAIALASAQKECRTDDVVVEDSHFKDAMNIVHESNAGSKPSTGNMDFPRSTEANIRYVISDAGERILPVPKSDDHESAHQRDLHVFDDHESVDHEAFHQGDSSVSDDHESVHQGELSLSDKHAEIKDWLLTIIGDAELCIPDANWKSWDAFQKASVGDILFRKTNYHAIDVLEGEPLIQLPPANQRRRRRQTLAERKPVSDPLPVTASGQIQDPAKYELVQETLPERIRINSPAIVKSFSKIVDVRFAKSFLLFRPFMSLFYYEQELRDIVTTGRELLRAWSESGKQPIKRLDATISKARLKAGLEEMECLVSFIDSELKAKRDNIRSGRRQIIHFADITLLFSPGDTVISKDHKQAYLVVNVTSVRHRVKMETRTKFQDNTDTVKFEDNPVCIECVCIDFDGKLLGSKSFISKISRYDGQVPIASLPVYPFEYSGDAELRNKLIERGKSFLKVARIRHMHYKGLTLRTRDEVDSQVVVDFDEAISRYPEWNPSVSSIVEEPDQEEPVIGEPSEINRIRGRLKQSTKDCVKECCMSEASYFDEHIASWRREDYIASLLKKASSATPPVSIIPRDIRHIEEDNTLTDDEYLIMSFRAFGLVLRSRKWHELDMTHMFEATTLGAGQGFDELVLPSGHGDLVKSMIRQHLRERNASGMNRERTDVVRGKGRGLIMLLHGVPGVGKTSTAECVADLFQRPLFQITSGDLGTTAKEVEDSLEENFSLASRWNSVLLIDEADVFLAERTKEDFVRNSLVAVFLRMMEYYAGVLFLTTNRVGVFDEAFTSRIHISLYYPPLDRDSTLQIFVKNWDRIIAQYKNAGRTINIKIPEITQFALDYFDNNKEGRWNGRQIRNAFQSALALAELEAWGTDNPSSSSVDQQHPVTLGRNSFDTVAESYKGFTSYLRQVYGADFARRARENLWRYDGFGAPRASNSLNTRLKVADPPMTQGHQWTGQGYNTGYGTSPRFAQPQYYPPQPPQHYPEHPSQHSQTSRYTPGPSQQSRDSRDRWDTRAEPEPSHASRYSSAPIQSQSRDPRDRWDARLEPDSSSYAPGQTQFESRDPRDRWDMRQGPEGPAQ